MSNTELINAYFDNELSPSEIKMFEDRLSRDAEFNREFKFQEDIIDGIKEARRQSLKARLDSVQVGGAATGGSWTAGKIAGLIGLAAVAGFGIYFFYPEETPVVSDTNTALEERMEEQDNPVVTDAEPLPEETVAADATAENEEITEEQALQPAGENNVNAEEAQEEADETVSEENKNPVVAPSFEDPRKEDTSVDLPEGEIAGKAVVAGENLEVSVENESRRYDFHYKLENDQLTLYGNFETDLYQILEFNTNDMKAWFLSFDNEYYSLKPTEGKVEKLEKVTDNALLKTLKEASKD